MAEYTPSEARVCIDYCNAVVARRRADPLIGMAEADAEFDRFLARVRRDAAREALDGLMHRFELEQGRAASLGRGLDAQRAKLSRLTTKTYRDTHYPEREDQT